MKSLCVNYPLLFSDLNETSIFPDRFSKKAQISSFIKIRQVGAEFFHADGGADVDRQTDMTKLIFAFRNFASAPKRVWTHVGRILTFCGKSEKATKTAG